jgi:CDGSH-type Zn-finger protein
MYSKNSPHIIDAKQGEEIYLCQCGQSAKAPYCDGSHKKTDQRPLVHTVDQDKQLYVCGCGNSTNLPWCDGSHNK